MAEQTRFALPGLAHVVMLRQLSVRLCIWLCMRLCVRLCTRREVEVKEMWLVEAGGVVFRQFVERGHP